LADIFDGAKSRGGDVSTPQWTLLADREIHKNQQRQSLLFEARFTVHAADLLGRLCRRFKEGGLMRRFVVLACIGLVLVSFPGCAKWKRKHFYRSACVEGDVCGCGSYATGAPIVGAPAAYDTVVPGTVISAPAKGPLPAAQF
jgi:hypothetical protein